MNDIARQKLIDAALAGVRQIKGKYADDEGGLCALGVLGMREHHILHWEERIREAGLDPSIAYACPHGCKSESKKGLFGEGGLVVHLNDKHDYDFLAIANKL